MRRVLALLTALLLALLAGCGGSSGTSGGSGAGESGQARQLRVGVIPIVDVAPIYLGQEQGFFADRGIELQLVPGSGGAAAVPGVVSGDLQFAFGNVTSVVLAASQDLPLRYVANGVASTGDPATDYSAVVVAPDSPIQSVADLQGKRVAVNNLKNIGEVTIRKGVQDAGGDPSSVQFVELAFPDMPGAVTDGNVDAAWVVEPFLTVARDQGARVVYANFAEAIDDLTVAGYFTTEQTVQQDAQLVEDFRAAIEQSLQYAADNPDEVRRIIGTYTEIDPAVAQKMALPAFPQDINVQSVQTVADLMQQYGISEQPVDAQSIMATG
jgi:NitT/TauT family transport system substrate-binding protein